jgi:hypothetical protein
MADKLTFAQLVSKFSRTGQFIIKFTAACQLNPLHIPLFFFSPIQIYAQSRK